MMKTILSLLLFTFFSIGYGQIVVPASDMVIECNSNVNTNLLNNWLNANGNAVASTACGPVTWSNDFSSLSSECGLTGSATVTFVATSDCGIATTSATFMIVDTSAPSLNVPPSPLTVLCTDPNLDTIITSWLDSNAGATTLTRGCDTSLLWTHDFEGLPTDCSETVTTMVIFTVTDPCGNASSTVPISLTIESTDTCPSIPLTLYTQAEVNAFATNFPNCIDMISTLTIDGTDIVDLTPLSQLQTVNNLVIQNTSLTTLDGLNLSTISTVSSTSNFNVLTIKDNLLLQSLDALSTTQFTNVEFFSIENNPALLSLNGLQNLSGHVFGIRIINNDALTDLVGLHSISSHESFIISDNDALLNLNGLDSLERGFKLSIISNSALENLEGLDNFVTGGFDILNNPNLTSLQGLDTMISLDYDSGGLEFRIEGNPLLSDISAIENVDFLYDGRYIYIRNNPVLSVCNVFSVCNAIANDGLFASSITVENNAEGCNSNPEVAFACGLIPSNDECIAASSLTLGISVAAYTDLATTSPQIPSCNDLNRSDVWFAFNSGTLTSVAVLVDMGYNLQLWEGACGALTPVPNACATGSLLDVMVSANTDYYVQVWSCSGCRTTLDTGLFTILVQDGTLGTAEASLQEIRLFPNPVSTQLTIASTNTIDHIDIYNLLGQGIHQFDPNGLRTDIDFSSFNPGVYFVKVTSNGIAQTFKVVRE